jgi:hypothetical protein
MQARTIYRRHRDCELGLWIKVTFGARRDTARLESLRFAAFGFFVGKIPCDGAASSLRRSIAAYDGSLNLA